MFSAEQGVADGTGRRGVGDGPEFFRAGFSSGLAWQAAIQNQENPQLSAGEALAV